MAKTEMKPVNLVLFGDQAVEKLSSIQTLVRCSKTSAGAQRLLREATDLVQLHLDQLSEDDRAWKHEVNTLLGLAEDNVAEAEPNAVIATVLMCIGRLGELIVHAEEDPSILGSQDDQVQVLAFCTGLLPAAALVAACDTSELFELAREIISITFRMSMAIQQRLTMIEDSSLSWATTLIGKTPKQVQRILDDFHHSKNIPYAKRIAVSVISTEWLTITGAPSSLRCLMDFSTELSDCPKIETDTKAAHTPYLPPLDMDAVLGDSPLLDTSITSKARILSPSSCKPYIHDTLRSLLSDMILDIVSRELLIDDTTNACVSVFKDKPVSLTVAGPTAHLPAVERILKARKMTYQMKRHRNSDKGIFSRGGSGLIAVVGMSARLPGSDNVDAFFESLMEGKIQLKKIPETRFDIDKYYDPSGARKNSTSTNQGAFLERPGYFDNRLFNISPREALQMDPLQRMLLTTSREALEMAGYSKDSTPSTQSNRIATYFGQAANDWRDVLNNDEIDIYYVPALSRPFGPGRLAYHHKWGGGTYSIDSACATSVTAIHLACQALSSRECDTALAGGGSLCVSPMTFAGLSKSGMISDRGGCRTYHDDADGYARGEGIGVVVLKRLEDALADNDNILGVIRGHARTYTTTSTSITHPSAESQAHLYEEVLRQTAMAPNEIAYVEMHGTGTQAGDLEEMTSVVRVLGRQRSKANVLTVGTVKANVGHGEGAAGVTSLIKVLMMMKERKIPPQPGLPFKINRNFPNLEALHVRIAGTGSKDLILRPSPASRNGKIQCLVSSFDASGGNTSLIVEEAPARPTKSEHPLKCHIVTLSAKTPTSLQQNQVKLMDFLTRNPDTPLADLAYTTTARRMHEALRVAYTGQSTKDILANLRGDVAKSAKQTPKKPRSMNVIFAFTGQGSQYVGMGRHLFQHSSYYRETLQAYQNMCEHQGLPKFLHLISEEKSSLEGLSTVIVQLAIVALEIATARLLKSWGVQPSLVIGHSLGEYSALCVAGVLSVSDALYLVGRRAQLMEQQLVPGQYAMLAIAKSVDATMHLLAAEKDALLKTQVACINTPNMTVVSGPITEVKHLQNLLEVQGSKSAILRTPYGFHSHHIDPILEGFEAITRPVNFSAPAIPIASSLLGKVVEAGDRTVFSSGYLVGQARGRVDFAGAVQAYENCSLAKSQSFWLEIGPEPVAVSLARSTLTTSSDQFLYTMKPNEDNWVSISNSLASLYRAGASINWPRFHMQFLGSLNLLKLPTYAFDEKDYWKPYVERVGSGSFLDGRSDLKNNSNEPKIPQFSTTSLQWVEDEVVEGKSISVTFASHTSEPDLYEAIQGHAVNGVAIMSMSIFCDMAKSAASYVYQKSHPDRKMPNMSIYDLDMTHALVVTNLDPKQIIKTKISFSGGTDASVSFTSTTNGSQCIEHGSLRIVFEDTSSWFGQQNQMSFLIDARIRSLKEMSSTGAAHRLMKPVIYRLFSNVVSYGTNYKAIEEVWIDNECRDAAGTIKLSNGKGTGKFLYNPFWSDSALHLGGFILNGGLKYNENIVCLCTGLGCLRVLEELRADEVYTTYAAIQDAETPNNLSGSAYIYDSKQKLVQIATGLRFQKMNRTTLGAILNPRPSHIPLPAGVGQKAMQWSEDLKSKISLGALTPASSSQTSLEWGNVGKDSGYATPEIPMRPDVLNTFLAIVSSECGCSEAELEPGTLFSDIGVDSLMAITIIATFRKQTSIELPVTFFIDHQTVSEAKDALSPPSLVSGSPALSDDGRDEQFVTSSSTSSVPHIAVTRPHDPKESGLSMDSEQATEPLKSNVPVLKEEPKEESKEVIKPSQVVLLHGSPSSVGPKLFLLPDGAGSPGCYIGLPSISPSLNIYAIKSPFVKCPAEFTCGMQAICESFLMAIRAVQANGPYLLGGFSFGALYAYEITRMILERGEAVDGLFILDMAVPNTIRIPSVITEQLVAEAGLLPSTGLLTAAQKEHVVNTVKAMASYRPTACIPSMQPRRTILLSSEEMLAAGKQTELARWAQGIDSAHQGWEKLIAGVIERRGVSGTHFSLLKYPNIKALRDIWADVFANM